MSALSKITDSVRASLEALLGGRQGSEKVGTAIEQARELERLAIAAAGEAEAEHTEALRLFDRERGLAALARKNSAEFDLGAARMAIEKLEEEARTEAYREDQERRRVSYETAKKELEAGAKFVEKGYPQLARGIVEIIERIAQSEALTASANANLPDGAVPLLSLQDRFLRHGFAREDISNEKVSRWVFEANGQIIDDALQSDVVDRGEGVGILLNRRDAGSSAISVGEGQSVVRRDFWRTTFLPHIASHPVDDGFASRIHLPAIAHHAPFWTPSHSDSPEIVLEHVEAVRAYARNFEKVNERRAVVEFTPIAASAPAEV